MKPKKTTVILILCVVAMVVILVCFFLPFGMPKTEEQLLKATITRVVCIACFAVLVSYVGYFAYCNRRLNAKTLLLCLPFMLVAVNNFPYTAYLTGLFTLSATAIEVVLYVTMCISIGIFEELFFRGVISVYLIRKFGKTRRGLVGAVLLSSAIFALSHLINLVDGASVGATLLQVGYSFLIGGMLTVCLLICGNIWVCATIHTVFNICGMSLNYFASGDTLDTATIVITAVIGVAVAIYAIVYLAKCNFGLVQEKFCVKVRENNN